MTRQWGLVLGLFLVATALTVAYFFFTPATTFISPLSPKPTPTPTPLPLLKYTFTNLKSTPPIASQIHIDSLLTQKPDLTSYLFDFKSDDQKVTGQLNVPNEATPSGGFPIVLMVRGYVDVDQYKTGIGTQPAAFYFASHGFVTIAPDFLGYGGSAPADPDTFAARLERPVTVINLLASIRSLDFVDANRLVMWAHSNGGQIALSVLEITGKPIPTALWAPVSKPFPYSILYYTDDSPDQGKALRKALAQFESQYDVFDYTIDRYFDWINAPLQINQGTADQSVPVTWSDALVKTLKDKSKDVTYYTYPGADHNLQPGWDTVVARNLQFYIEHLKS